MATKTKRKSSKKPRKMIGIRKASAGIPTRLVALRLMKGWSQKEAAERIGVSVPIMGGLESSGKFGFLEDLLVRIANVYGTSLDYIYGRSESAIERFALAPPEVQVSILNGIMSGLAHTVRSPETLRYVDELVTMVAEELPDWPAVQSFRDAPPTQRTAMLSQLAFTIGRVVRDREALKYVTAIVLQFAKGTGAPTGYTYSIEKDQQTLSHQVTSIERMFGHSEPAREEMTPSRFRVAPEPERMPKPKPKPKKKSKKSSVKKPASKK